MSDPAEPAQPSALSGWLVLGVRQVGLTLVTLVGVVTLGRILGPSDFAVYSYVTVGVTLALAVGDFGLGGRIIRDPVTEREMQAIFGAQLLLVAVLAAAGSGLLVTLAVDDRIVVGLAGAALLLALLQALPTAALERAQDFRRIGMIEVGQRLVFTAAAILLCSTGLERTGVPAAAAGAGVAAYAAALWASRWHLRPRIETPRGLLGGFAAHWWHGRLATQLAYTAYPVLAAVMLSDVAVSHLAVALTIVSLAALLAPLVARATFPAMAAMADRDGRPEVFAEVFRAFAVASVPALAVVAIGARSIVELFFGAEWLGAVEVVRAICLPTIAGLALTPSLPLLYLMLDARRVKRLLLAWFVAQWALCAVGAALLGVVGMPIGGAIAAAVLMAVLDRELRAAAGGFSMLAELARPVAAGAAAIAVGFTVIVLIGDTAGAGIAATVAGLGAYVVAVGSRRALLDPRRLGSELARGLTPVRSAPL